MAETGLVKYQARDGQELTLSMDIVKKFLVQGRGDLVTQQECMYFLGVCKSRGLNPFKRDAYIIKYGNEAAAIVTSIDYFRSRARAQKDCRGWKAGVIVQKADGTVRDSAGLVLDGEKVVGGFFEGRPEGWTEPMRLEVNLNGYIKKKSDGSITRFWQAENQPTMIAKVAESQGLRRLWPDEFQGLYEKGEIQEPIDITPIDQDDKQRDQDADWADGARAFDAAIGELFSRPMMQKFIIAGAKQQNMKQDQFKSEVVGDLDNFLAMYEKWCTAQAKVEQAKKEQPPHSDIGKRLHEEGGPPDSSMCPKKEPEQNKPAENLYEQKGAQISWLPLESSVQAKYGAEKNAILKETAKGYGLDITGKLPREVHQMIIDASLERAGAGISDQDGGGNEGETEIVDSGASQGVAGRAETAINEKYGAEAFYDFMCMRFPDVNQKTIDLYVADVATKENRAPANIRAGALNDCSKFADLFMAWQRTVAPVSRTGDNGDPGDSEEAIQAFDQVLAQLDELHDEFPRIHMIVVKGRTPKTIEDAQEYIRQIKAEVEVKF